MSTATSPAPAGRTHPAGPPAGRDDTAAGRRRGGPHPARRVLAYLALLLLTLLFISPLLYMLVTSFKTTAQAGSATPQ